MNPYVNVSIPVSLMSVSALNDLLAAIEDAAPFDDVNIAGGRNIMVKAGGRVYRLSGRIIKGREVDALAGDIGRGANVPTDVRAMRQLDPGYQFTHQDRIVYRYRVNISAIRSDSDQQLKITMRAIRADIPSLEYVMLEEADFQRMISGPGLVIISGETGSGKTTTIAAAIGELIRRSPDTGDGRIISAYEQPTEFMYERLVAEILKSRGECNVEVYQHEIGSDLPSFSEGIRNALRSNPDIILLGEARELETIQAALTFALSGHLVFITTHAKGAIATLMRLISEFPESRQTSAFLSFLSCTKMIMSQQLAPSEVRGRAPIRESIVISNELQRQFALCSTFEQANSMFVKHFDKAGRTFDNSAEEMLRRGLISDVVAKHFSEA